MTTITGGNKEDGDDGDNDNENKRQQQRWEVIILCFEEAGGFRYIH